MPLITDGARSPDLADRVGAVDLHALRGRLTGGLVLPGGPEWDETFRVALGDQQPESAARQTCRPSEQRRNSDKGTHTPAPGVHQLSGSHLATNSRPPAYAATAWLQLRDGYPRGRGHASFRGRRPGVGSAAGRRRALALTANPS
jgi:hypothetical protein